jgi:glutaredoxin
MNFDDIKIPGDIVTVEGEKKMHSVFVFALSTCMWCKKGKQWLKDNGYTYSYVDVDLLPLDKKRDLKGDLREVFNVLSIRYPFLVIDGMNYYSGFNIDIWKEMFSE